MREDRGQRPATTWPASTGTRPGKRFATGACGACGSAAPQVLWTCSAAAPLAKRLPGRVPHGRGKLALTTSVCSPRRTLGRPTLALRARDGAKQRLHRRFTPPRLGRLAGARQGERVPLLAYAARCEGGRAWPSPPRLPLTLCRDPGASRLSRRCALRARGRGSLRPPFQTPFTVSIGLSVHERIRSYGTAVRLPRRSRDAPARTEVCARERPALANRTVRAQARARSSLGGHRIRRSERRNPLRVATAAPSMGGFRIPTRSSCPAARNSQAAPNGSSRQKFGALFLYLRGTDDLDR